MHTFYKKKICCFWPDRKKTKRSRHKLLALIPQYKMKYVVLLNVKDLNKIGGAVIDSTDRCAN